jgi:DNA-binding MarR family transcriptional regulator
MSSLKAPEGGRTAAEIGRTLEMDKARLSRIVARFIARGLASKRINPDHRKHRPLTLTDAGWEVFAGAEAAVRAQVDALLEPIDASGRNRVIEAMRDIRTTLRAREAPGGNVSLRSLRPGDIGWIIHRQTVLYAQEYAGTGPTRGSPVAFSGLSSPNSTPPEKMAGSPSAAARSSVRFS